MYLHLWDLFSWGGLFNRWRYIEIIVICRFTVSISAVAMIVFSDYICPACYFGILPFEAWKGQSRPHSSSKLGHSCEWPDAYREHTNRPILGQTEFCIFGKTSFIAAGHKTAKFLCGLGSIYQTIPFSVYIHNLMFLFWSECSEKSPGTVVILQL